MRRSLQLIEVQVQQFFVDFTAGLFLGFGSGAAFALVRLVLLLHLNHYVPVSSQLQVGDRLRRLAPTQQLYISNPALLMRPRAPSGFIQIASIAHINSLKIHLELTRRHVNAA